MLSFRSFFAIAVPALGTITILWFWRRKRGNVELDHEKPPDKDNSLQSKDRKPKANTPTHMSSVCKNTQRTLGNNLGRIDEDSCISGEKLTTESFNSANAEHLASTVDEECQSINSGSKADADTKSIIQPEHIEPVKVAGVACSRSAIIPRAGDAVKRPTLHISQDKKEDSDRQSSCEATDLRVLSPDVANKVSSKKADWPLQDTVNVCVDKKVDFVKLESSDGPTNNNNSSHPDNSRPCVLSWADSMEEEEDEEPKRSLQDTTSTPHLNKLDNLNLCDSSSNAPDKGRLGSNCAIDSKEPMGHNKSTADKQNAEELSVKVTTSDISQSICSEVTAEYNSEESSTVGELSKVVQELKCEESARKSSRCSETSPRSSSSSNGSSESGSCDQDMHSEVSADSGHGGSNVEVPSPVTVAGTLSSGEHVSYEFDFPTEFCGQLIGKFGRNINRIKDASGVDVSVNKKMYTQDYQTVVLEGTQAQIDKALVLLREKFPEKRFPGVTFLPAQSDSPVLYPEMMQLSLPDGVSVDSLVSSVVSPNHLFLQQPTHPSFHMLETLNHCMNACYMQENVVPELPRPIEVGVICAAPMYNTGWYRAQVVQIYDKSDDVDIKFVDYGGYMTIQGSHLRQIRSDFSQLPFQAVECYLANIMPPNGEAFPVESVALMEQLVHNKLLQAQVVGHEENGVPYVQLYDLQADKMVFVNRELVDRGAAEWIEHFL